MEETCAELYGQQKIRGFLHLYIGEEACAVGALHALTDDDNILATYREHGHALIRGVPMTAIMAEMYGKASGCSRGRGGSMHLFDASRRFFGGTAIVGSGLPQAVGLALADTDARPAGYHRVLLRRRRGGRGRVPRVAQPRVALASAGAVRLENNLYAMGTALARAQAQTDLASKAAGYAMPSSVVDGMDVERGARRGRGRRRAGAGRGRALPLELRTYRFRAHSMFDAELYRDRAEVEEWRRATRSTTYAARLRAEGSSTTTASAGSTGRRRRRSPRRSRSRRPPPGSRSRTCSPTCTHREGRHEHHLSRRHAPRDPRRAARRSAGAADG